MTEAKIIVMAVNRSTITTNLGVMTWSDCRLAASARNYLDYPHLSSEDLERMLNPQDREQFTLYRRLLMDARAAAHAAGLIGTMDRGDGVMEDVDPDLLARRRDQFGRTIDQIQMEQDGAREDYRA